MWMMGYSDGGGDFNTIQDRKLRPLIPRPASSCLSRIHGADIFALNHHLGKSIQSFITFTFMYMHFHE